MEVQKIFKLHSTQLMSPVFMDEAIKHRKVTNK